MPGSADSESDMYVFLIIKDVATFLSRKIALIHTSNQKCTRVHTSSLAIGIIGPPFFHLISVNCCLLWLYFLSLWLPLNLSLFSCMCWSPGIAFLWITYSHPWLSFLLCCLSLTYLFCKSSLYIIAVHPLISGLLPRLVFIYWLSLWWPFQAMASHFYLIKYVCMYFIASEFPTLIKKLSPTLDFTCGDPVLLLFQFLHLDLQST